VAIKTVVEGLSTSPVSWNTGGRPSKRDIVKNPPRQISQLGSSTWESNVPGKAPITGKGQK
jgi:hypothetical protein